MKVMGLIVRRIFPNRRYNLASLGMDGNMSEAEPFANNGRKIRLTTLSSCAG